MHRKMRHKRSCAMKSEVFSSNVILSMQLQIVSKVTTNNHATFPIQMYVNYSTDLRLLLRHPVQNHRPERLTHSLIFCLGMAEADVPSSDCRTNSLWSTYALGSAATVLMPSQQTQQLVGLISSSSGKMKACGERSHLLTESTHVHREASGSALPVESSKALLLAD